MGRFSMQPTSSDRTSATRLLQVRESIHRLENRYRRIPGSVRLLAVSKKKSVEDIVSAASAGQRDFGESYLQEALEKIAALENENLCWHFVGPIQKNKTRQIATHFDWVHGIERLIVAERLSTQRPSGLPPLQVCLQVNIDREHSKSGVQCEQVQDLASALQELPNLELRGLMAIPRQTSDTIHRRRRFAQLREMLEQLNESGFGLDTLSMGMSDDLEAAVAEGATIVRIGTAIFGARMAK